jgi:hypothetical protein
VWCEPVFRICDPLRVSIPSFTAVTALVAISGVTAVASDVVSGQTINIPPVAKTYKPPARSPVTFRRVPSAQNFSLGFKQGTALKRGQTIEFVIARGNDVIPPRACPCQGLGLVKPKGQKLASVYVQARSSSGRVLATAPPKQLFIEGNGTEGLVVGFTYAFANGTKSFPKGSRLNIYGFFTRG